MKNKTEKKRQKEKELITQIIECYCRGHHHTKDSLCDDCQKLEEYAILRLEKCPFMETKKFCSNCTVHCYNQINKDKIKVIMRYSGPRVLLHHPMLVTKHICYTLIERRK